MVIAIDFDYTIWDSLGKCPLPGAREAISNLREQGHKIVIHSCNNPKYIQFCLENADIRYDYLWDERGKPICDLYLDDRALHFTSWEQATSDIERMQSRDAAEI